MIQCQGLRKQLLSQADRTALCWQPADLTVARGEAVLIQGPSGCGKTTLLNTIAGLIHPDAGTLRVGDAQVETLTPADADRFRGSHIGMVFQSFQLLSVLTVEENVLLAARYGRRWGAAEAVARTRALLQRVGLADRRGHQPSELSVGEQQRVALARAVVNEPPVLLADEPTASLDAVNAASVMDLLFGLCRDHGITLVAVSHDTSLGPRFDRVIAADGWVRSTTGGCDD
jgi:putative ABC transport system ATP-binding protein